MHHLDARYDAMGASQRMYLEGLFDSWAWENGLRENGFSKHRVPALRTLHTADRHVFDPEDFLAVANTLDSEASVFTWGFVVQHGEVFVQCACSEASQPDDDFALGVEALRDANREDGYVMIRMALASYLREDRP